MIGLFVLDSAFDSPQEVFTVVEWLTLVEGLLFLGMILAWGMLALLIIPHPKVLAGRREKAWARILSVSMMVITAGSAYAILSGGIAFREDSQGVAYFFVVLTLFHGAIPWALIIQSGYRHAQQRRRDAKDRRGEPRRG